MSFLGKKEAGLAAEDDWSGTTDRKRRRQMQNRLNQRARRSRMRKMLHLSEETQQELAPYVPDHRPDDVGHWEQIALSKFLGSPQADLLLTLVQYNVCRALLQNTFSLGISTSWLEEEAESIVPSGQYNPLVPASLLPTRWQRDVAHHPWIDVLPFPGLRDNILRMYDTCDEDALCGAIVGWCNSPGTRTGIIVWGEPWDPCGWEATEGFCIAFGWALEGCSDLLRATNFWRMQRDEEPLQFESMWRTTAHMQVADTCIMVDRATN